MTNLIKNYSRRTYTPKIPTDLEIFNAIYNIYYEEFTRWAPNSDGRENKNYVPIDIQSIAKNMGVDGDIIYGRLEYLHKQEYGYAESDSNGKLTRVPFFDKQIGRDMHVIHFPVMVSVLADLRKEEYRNKVTVRLAFAAITVSIISAAISTIAFFN